MLSIEENQHQFSIMASRFRKIFQITSVTIFILSLFLPAFKIANGSTYTGSDAFSGGAFAIFLVGSQDSLFLCFAWFANVSFFVGQMELLISHRPFGGFVSAIISLVLGGSFALVKRTSIQGMCALNAISLRSGYMFWILSMLLLLLSGLSGLWEVDGWSSFIKSKRALIILATICIAYILIGLLLPRGGCRLLN